MKARVIPSQPETALLYHLDEGRQEGITVRETLSQYRIAARNLPEEALGQTVASFLAEMPPVPAKKEPYAGTVILFSGVEAKKQQEVLRALREKGAGRGAIKAVVTPTNRGWTFEKLFAELNAEHELMTAPKTPEQEDENETD